jgi:hypothetical protein
MTAAKTTYIVSKPWGDGDSPRREYMDMKEAQAAALLTGERVFNVDGYDVTKCLEPGEIGKCSKCGVVGVNAFCETEDGCAPICSDCYRKHKEENETCPCCGRSGRC